MENAGLCVIVWPSPSLYKFKYIKKLADYGMCLLFSYLYLTHLAEYILEREIFNLALLTVVIFCNFDCCDRILSIPANI
jgi:hypothetical protein